MIQANIIARTRAKLPGLLLMGGLFVLSAQTAPPSSKRLLPPGSAAGEGGSSVGRSDVSTPPKRDNPTLSESDASRPQSSALRTYRIGCGDVLQISVWKEPDASVPTVTVRSDGKIALPIIKEVDARGLTPPELEKVLTEKFSRFINAPEVTVVVKEIQSEKVYLVGAVKREGSLVLKSPMTVLQVLAEAGGLTDYAKKNKIYVLRTQNQKQLRLPFNYKEVIKGEHMEQNIAVQPGDTIVVPQ